MKQGTITALITIIAAGAILMMSCSNDSQASDVMKEGAELGSWTMDYKAALALAIALNIFNSINSVELDDARSLKG